VLATELLSISKERVSGSEKEEEWGYYLISMKNYEIDLSKVY
jgi:hypothetical protein